MVRRYHMKHLTADTCSYTRSANLKSAVPMRSWILLFLIFQERLCALYLRLYQKAKPSWLYISITELLRSIRTNCPIVYLETIQRTPSAIWYNITPSRTSVILNDYISRSSSYYSPTHFSLSKCTKVAWGRHLVKISPTCSIVQIFCSTITFSMHFSQNQCVFTA